MVLPPVDSELKKDFDREFLGENSCGKDFLGIPMRGDALNQGSSQLSRQKVISWAHNLSRLPAPECGNMGVGLMSSRVRERRVKEFQTLTSRYLVDETCLTNVGKRVSQNSYSQNIFVTNFCHKKRNRGKRVTQKSSGKTPRAKARGRCCPCVVPPPPYSKRWLLRPLSAGTAAQRS